MSDCGVSISADWDCDVDYVYFGARIVKTRKQRRCCECGKKIEPGERAVYHAGTNDGSFWTSWCCLICDEIADAFSCDGRMFGNLWDGMHYVWEALTTSCFDKLKTPEAKAELRRRWMTWRGLTA